MLLKKFVPVLAVLAAGRLCAATLLPDFAPPEEGQQVVINIPQKQLFLFENGKVVKTYPVTVGKKSTPTPPGSYTIGSIARNPAWHIPASIKKERAAAGLPAIDVIPAGPNNPLGPVFVRLGDPKLGLGIHGTNAPSSVPGFRSHGCVRMRSPNALDFSKTIRSGSPAAVIYQTVSLNADASHNLWLATYTDPYTKKNLNQTLLKQSISQWAEAHGKTVNPQRISAALAKRNGTPVCVTCSKTEKITGTLKPLAWTSGKAETVKPKPIVRKEESAAEKVIPLEPAGTGDSATSAPVDAMF